MPVESPKTAKKVSIEPQPETAASAPIPEPVAAQAPPPATAPSELDTLLKTARLLGFALSARALLFIALCGAFILGAMAMIKGGWMPLLVLVAYGLFAVCPTAYLEIKRRS